MLRPHASPISLPATFSVSVLSANFIYIVIKLIAEVVSTNWQNDYARKVEDYALLGVPEDWIVDYLGLGGREYIGKPKQPTITACQLAEDFYEKRLVRQDDWLTSAIFPELQLQAGAIFAAGQL